MWSVLGPLISYLASLVFHYMPFARGDARKRKESGGGGGTRVWRILTAGAKCVCPGFLASWRIPSAKKLRATGASASRHKANTTELRATPSPAQQLCLPVTFSHFLVLNGFVSRSPTSSPLRRKEKVGGFHLRLTQPAASWVSRGVVHLSMEGLASTLH